MKRILLVILVLSVASICYAADETEEITLTTYYPAPYGDYNELLVSGNTYLAVDSGNVGIGTSSPQAQLDVSSTNSGFLIPRFADHAAIVANVTSPVEGMMVYNLAGHIIEYHNGTTWIPMSGGGGGGATFGNWVNLTSSFVWGRSYGPVATDGFIALWAVGYHGGGGAVGYTDSSSNPTTRVTGQGAGYVSFSNGIMMPVKKGDYWKISRTHGGYGSSKTVRWIPLQS